jgi:hypothetical protein
MAFAALFCKGHDYAFSLNTEFRACLKQRIAVQRKGLEYKPANKDIYGQLVGNLWSLRKSILDLLPVIDLELVGTESPAL